MTSPTTSDMSPLAYTADGRLHDTYRLLDRFRPAPAGSRRAAEWAERERDIAREERAMRAEILAAAAADLDPADTSDQAAHLREVAEQARDHTEMDAQRIEWAVAALRVDPTLADRLPPAILDVAVPLLTTPDAGTTDAGVSAPDAYQHDVTADQVLGDTEAAGPDPGHTPPAQTEAALSETALSEGELPDLGL